MSTITQNLGNISKDEAYLLIDKYLDLVEDLEDYIAINNHSTGKNKAITDDEAKNLFASLSK